MKLSQLRGMAGKLFRSVENQKRYVKHRESTLRKYASYEDYIKIRHMGRARGNNGFIFILFPLNVI